MIINGGGYSIYASLPTSSSLALENIILSDIQLGVSHRWGDVYKTKHPNVVFDDLRDTESLYVASVWKDTDKNIHLSVSNDTNKEKSLIVVTSKETLEFTIPACPTYSELIEDQTSYNDFPFDINIVVDNADWVVCFDGTTSLENQIRYFNWTDQSVLINAPIPIEEEIVSDDLFKDEVILVEDNLVGHTDLPIEGSVGKSITYNLSNTGILTLAGTGSTSNYNSRRPAPWYEIRDNIKAVIIEDGITTLGSQLFAQSPNISYVELPNSLKIIGSNVFIGNDSLKNITIPTSVNEIGPYAFHATTLESIDYDGSNLAWNNISIGDCNAPLLASTIHFPITITSNAIIEIDSGSAGKNISWILYNDGSLILIGTGSTNRYNSRRSAPWSNYTNEITSITISSGITSLGSQLFRNLNAIESIVLPDSISSIGNNTFIGCSSLDELTFSNNVLKIGDYATWGTSLSDVYYDGSKDDWNAIYIGDRNKLTDATIHFNK